MRIDLLVVDEAREPRKVVVAQDVENPAAMSSAGGERPQREESAATARRVDLIVEESASRCREEHAGQLQRRRDR
jgi:hypothetical protein